MRSLVFVVLPVFLSGCLGTAYQVPLGELDRIVQLPPEQRGVGVRVVQLDQGAERLRSRPIVTTETTVRVDVDSDDRDTRSGSGGGEMSAEAAAIMAVVLVATAVGVMAALSARESERYDGWVAVDPNLPAYLRLGDGSWVSAPLAELSPAHLADVHEARVILEEGSFEPMGRAPLDRTGFAYGIDLGAAGVTSARSGSTDPWPWFQARMGGFPIQELGIYGSVGFVFASDRGTLMNFRYAAEVDVMPIQVELFSLGFYVHAGLNHRLHDFEERTHEALAGFYGGGIVVELEVTTHLGVALRGGLSAVHESWGILPLAEVGIGANVY